MKTIIALILGLILTGQRVFAGDKQPEYLQSFNPTNGFKPAQRDLTEIFLQMAGSLEYYGSPEPYLRHVKAEQKRLEAKRLRQSGKQLRNYCPAYATDEYLDKLAKNWDLLSPKLGLKPWAQDIGDMMREGIKGTRSTGTIAVEIFNDHQSRVYDSMVQGGELASFDLLKSNLVSRLELDKKTVNEEEYEIPRRDAVSYAICIKGVTTKLFKKLDANLKPEDAERIKTVLTSIFMDVGRMAQSELELGIAEWAMDKKSAK